MSDEEWKCSGCGAESPNQLRSCDCVTNVLYKRGNRHAWKIDAAEVQAIAQAIKLLEAQGYIITSRLNPGADAEPATSVRLSRSSDQVGRTGGSIPPTGAIATQSHCPRASWCAPVVDDTAKGPALTNGDQS